MKKRLLFERLCRDVVAIALASSGAGCGAIASEPSPGGSAPTPSTTNSSPPTNSPTPPTTVEVLDPLVCEGGKWSFGFAGYTPEPAVDYIAMRYEVFQPEFDAGAAPIVTTSDEFGNKCATASNRTQCLADLEAFRRVRTESDCVRGQIGCGNSYLVYTRGDTVGAAMTREEVVRFFGTVESPEEAFYLALVDGYHWRCADPKATARRVDGSLEIVVVQGACGPEDKVVLRVAPDGTTQVVSTERLNTTGSCAGRRPEGMCVEDALYESDSAGAHLARTAELEAAAVSAFAIMADELEALDAPPTLVKQAHAARRDEIRHARTMARLARARGARPRRVDVNRRRDRAVVDIAIENAVEGCVRETYAALVALFQAERAHEADVREAMVAIATDELRHAELSWRVGEWLDTRLDEGARAEVEAARARAVRDLAHDIEGPVDADAMVALGLPSKSASRALYRGLCETFGLDPVTPS